MATIPARDRGWIMVQPWYDVLFTHWPMPDEALRPRLPAGLELDTYGGRAWLGILAVRMRGVRVRGLPPLPLLSSLAQVNVRTYVVSRRGGPGVFFFGLYAGSLLASLGARIAFALPYYTADVSVRAGRVDCRAWRTDPPRAALSVTYRPLGEPTRAAAGTLEHWFAERYRLYTAGSGGHLYHGDIAHEPWTLQPAELTVLENSLAAAHGLPSPPDPPVAHCSRGRETRLWPLRLL